RDAAPAPYYHDLAGLYPGGATAGFRLRGRCRVAPNHRLDRDGRHAGGYLFGHLRRAGAVPEHHQAGLRQKEARRDGSQLQARGARPPGPRLAGRGRK
nr:hypothetical protein [Tanacetum cinerariifolium]